MTVKYTHINLYDHVLRMIFVYSVAVAKLFLYYNFLWECLVCKSVFVDDNTGNCFTTEHGIAKKTSI